MICKVLQKFLRAQISGGQGQCGEMVVSVVGMSAVIRQKLRTN